MHPSQSLEAIEAVVESLRIGEYDLLIFGDGSGNSVTGTAGWCIFAHDPRLQRVWTYFAGLSNGTNNYAELAPYVHALWAYHTEVFGQGGVSQPLKVYIVSDSEVTVRCGNRDPNTGKTQYQRKSNLALWASIEWFEDNGYNIEWVHVRRNTNPLNAEADRIAGQARSKVGEVQV